jgi:large subunit ribosomal protein L4
MKSITIFGLDGNKIGQADLPDELFAVAVGKHVLHEVVRAEEAAARQGNHDTKTRGEVSGGGKKPWKQKGTGRARHGSTRSPIWRKGGVVFGPHPRDYDMKMNRKVKKLALAGALSARANEERVIGLEAKGLAEPRTAAVAKFLRGFDGIRKPLFIHTAEEGVLAKSIRNLPNAQHRNVGNLSARSVLLSDLVILTPSAITALGAAGAPGAAAAAAAAKGGAR